MSLHQIYSLALWYSLHLATSDRLFEKNAACLFNDASRMRQDAASRVAWKVHLRHIVDAQSGLGKCKAQQGSTLHKSSQSPDPAS
jgi:hypothetical protein